MKFGLYEDVKVTTWCRYSYEVEAETLEEAVELVKDGDVDSTDMEEFFEATCSLHHKRMEVSLLTKFI